MTLHSLFHSYAPAKGLHSSRYSSCDVPSRVIKVESRERGAERMAPGIRRVRNGRTARVHAAQYRGSCGTTMNPSFAVPYALKLPRSRWSAAKAHKAAST
jgi:hypothetical protein